MPRRLLVPQDDLALPGLAKLGNVIVIIHAHQLYAVERWIVDRSALLRLLVVYTGDPAHSVHLHVYHADDTHWPALLRLLAAPSAAKPTHTPHGVLLLTSLPRFRSDYSIVHIPTGLYSRPISSRLAANIALLRLGSSGRTALTLSDPSEPTNERFVSSYHTHPDLVLPLVALIQSALSVFGYPLQLDGLLCDSTLQAIGHWIRVFADPSDRTVDPSFIATLLSLVISTRNKLAHLGYSHLLSPDPFAHPLTSLSPALAAYSHSESTFVPLTKHLITSINASFDSKRLSRVIRTKLNSDTDNLLSPISDLPSLVSLVSSSPGIAPDSLTTIWSDPPLVRKSRKRIRGGVASDGDNPHPKKYDGRSTEEESDPLHRFSGSFHWPPRKVKLRSWAGLTKRKHQSVDLTPSVKSQSPQRTDIEQPEIVSRGTASGRVPALTLNTNFGKHRLSAIRRSTIGPAPTAPSASASASIFSLGDAGRVQSPTLPALQTPFFGEGDDEDLLSSGQVSPLSDSQTRPNPFSFSLGGSQAHLRTTAGVVQSNPYLHPQPYSSIYSANISANNTSARTATGDLNLNIDEKMLARLLLDKRKGKKRRDSNDTSDSPGGSRAGAFGGRIASWAGPISVGVPRPMDSDGESEEEGSEVSEVGLSGRSMNIARSKGISASAGLVAPEGWGSKEREKERARFDNMVRVVDGEGRLVEEEMDSEDDEYEEGHSGEEYGMRSRIERASGNEEVDESGEDDEIDEEEEERREVVERRAARAVSKGELKRRRSFHDLDTFRALEVLSPERMRIDVELCGQCLIMWRREKHLRNVVNCVRLLTSTLSNSNAHLRTHYQSYLPTLTSLPASATPAYAPVYSSSTAVAAASSNPSSNVSRSSSPKPPSSPPPLFSQSPSPPTRSLSPLPANAFPAYLLQSMDEASQQTERFSQATNTLLYENKQFDVGGLWSWVERERRKVWALRGGVFGEGNSGAGAGDGDGNNGVGTDGLGSAGVGRKLPEGVHGAHGSFNRLQWRLDGRSVLVDELGRTESEAEEEERFERGGAEVDGDADVAVARTGESALELEMSREGGGGQDAMPGQAKDEGKTRKEDEEIELEFLDRHLGIKPMWLLKFFTSWGARWSASGTGVVTEEADRMADVDETVDANETDGTSAAADQGQGQIGIESINENGSGNEAR